MKRPVFNRKLALPGLLIATGLFLVGGLALRFRPVPALTHRVDRGPVRMEIRGTGTLEGVQEVPVAFRMGGRIVDLPMEEGALVQEGQILGRLDPEESQRALDVAQANQALSVTGVSRAQAELEHAEAVLEKAQADLERAKALAAQGILSRADLDAAVERARIADAQAKASRDARRQALGSVQVARAGTAVQQRTLEENLLRAPMDGLLVKRLREPGHVVAAGTPVYTLVSTKKFWVRAWVDETALGFLAPGQVARVEFRSAPGRSFSARVDRVGRTVDQQTHELLVDIELMDLPLRFAVGQRADAVIHPEGATALRVPRVFTPASGAAFWVERNGRAMAVPVRLGRVGEDYVEVLDGLQEGDRVIRRATGTFQEGQRVSLREDAS
jgi:RND family efflux transporter MFP subunit